MLYIINIIILIYLNDSSIYRFSKHRVTTCCRYFENVYYHRLIISEVYQEILNDKCKSGVEVYISSPAQTLDRSYRTRRAGAGN